MASRESGKPLTSRAPLAFVARPSIKRKLILYFVALVLLPTATLGVVGPLLYERSIERETTDHTARMIRQVTTNIDFRILEAERLIDTLALEYQVRSFLLSGSATPAGRGLIANDLSAITDSHREIVGLLVVTEGDADVSDGFYRVTRDPLPSEPWYKSAKALPGRVVLVPRPVGRNIRSSRLFGADEVVSLAKAVTDPISGKVLGVILADVRLAALAELFEGTALGKGGCLFVADATDGFVYAPVNPIVYRVPIDAVREDGSGTITRIRDADYQVLSQRSAYTHWRTVGVFSLAEAFREVSTLRLWAFLIGGLTMALATVFAILFASSLARPILSLRSTMKRAECGDLAVRYLGGTDDEIGELGQGLNEMLDRIQDLIGQVYREQHSKREAELRILQEQIKPHFLYNTLDTIQWMAQENRVDDVVCMVGALTRLFRIGLNRGKELIPLSEELAHVESYLCIQKMRYEDKFDYSMSAAEGLGGRRVLRLILQPLVENAIYHGIKERHGHGQLGIGVRVEGEILLLEVSDDGVGMGPEELAALNESLETDAEPAKGRGYGLCNVNQRIVLTFGKPYGLSFRSERGKGTVATVRHPILAAED
jgi:two-component system, sensor histidine kinase YesM